MVTVFIHDPDYLKRGVKKIDGFGVLLLTVSLTAMQIVLERGESEGWFESRMITFWSYYALSLLALNAGFWNLIPSMLVMGMGMPFIFVTLSTVSLSSIPKPYMTDATRLYTLTRRVGGNIGYAMAATIVSH